MAKTTNRGLNRFVDFAEAQPQGVKQRVRAASSVGALPLKLDSQPNPENEAFSNPCLSCVETPCCKRLPLERIKVQTRSDLESLRKYLGHRWFEVGLKDDGTWMLFYQRPCRHLDTGYELCAVHGTPPQPWTCKEYPSHFTFPPPQKERHLSLFEFRQNFSGVRILRGKRTWVTVVETYE